MCYSDVVIRMTKPGSVEKKMHQQLSDVACELSTANKTKRKETIRIDSTIGNYKYDKMGNGGINGWS